LTAPAIRFASRPTPWIIADEAEYKNGKPTKYMPGSLVTTPA
jgi:hypothetical protein